MSDPLRVLYATSADSDMFFATRSSVHDPFFLVEGKGRQFAYLDKRDIDPFREACPDTVEAVHMDEAFLKRVGDLAESADLGPAEALALITLDDVGRRLSSATKALIVSERFPLLLADFLRNRDWEISVQAPFFPERMTKDAAAIAAIRQANEKATIAFEFIQETLREATIQGGMVMRGDEPLTSEWLKQEVAVLYLRQGLTLPEGLIIASGPQSAQPHHTGSGPLMAHAPIICDIFPKDSASGYYADITRTYFKGEPTEAVARMYRTVHIVQETQVRMMKPGAMAADIHEAGCDLFREAGYEVSSEQGFVHKTGHGLGLDLHEPTSEPLRLGPGTDLILEPGHVLTVEPGLYYPESGGIRIEDDILITESGHEDLTNLDKDLTIL